MAGASWPTFAEWQRSRGIPSWEWVHARRSLVASVNRAARHIGEALLPAFVHVAAMFRRA